MGREWTWLLKQVFFGFFKKKNPFILITLILPNNPWMVAGRAGRVLFHLYCRKKSPAAPTNTARWKSTGFIVYRDTMTYICRTKLLTAVFQRLSVLQNNKWDEDTELGRCSTDTGNAAFCLYTLRCWIYSLLVWTMPISTFGGVLQCKWLTWN